MSVTNYGVLFFFLFMDLALFAILGALPISVPSAGIIPQAGFDAGNMADLVLYNMPGTGIVVTAWWTLHASMIALLIANWVRGI